MKTPLFARYQKGGVFTIVDERQGTGDIWWVDSGSATKADSVGAGQNPDKPFATLDYAIGRCTANNGDIIYVMPGHAETVSIAGGIACDVAGISIIGLGEGADRPTITFSATGSTMTVSASAVKIKNIVFLATEAVVNTVVVTGEYFTMENCLFIGNAAAQTHKIPIITTADANDMVLDNINIQLLVAEDGTTAITTTSSEAVRLVGADRVIIKNCYFSGDFTTSAINGITTASKDIQILNNTVNNIATENIAGGIDLVAACTGFIDGNKIYVAYAVSTATLIDGSSCIYGLNYVNNTTGEAMALYAQSEATDAVVSVGTQITAVASQATSIATGAVSLGTQVTAVASQATSIATGAVSLGTQVTGVASQATSIATGAVSLGTQITTVASQATSIATGTVSVGTQTTAVASQATSIATGTVSVGTQVLSAATSIGTGTSVIDSQTISIATAVGLIYSMVASHVA